MIVVIGPTKKKAEAKAEQRRARDRSARRGSRPQHHGPRPRSGPRTWQLRRLVIRRHQTFHPGGRLRGASLRDVRVRPRLARHEGDRPPCRR